MKPATWLASSTLVALTLGCSNGATGRPARLADGGYSLSCRGPLSECLRHAERLCRDQGYTVRDARDIQERLGAETGQSQVIVEKSEATIDCGESRKRPAIPLQRETELPATAPAPAATASTRACVPGSSQACVGPGGCSGGQACSSDGSRFEPCNCGAPTAPAP